MPAIAGIIDKQSTGQSGGMLQSMLEEMVHQAGENTGTYCNRELGVYLGWVSRKKEDADRLPLWNEEGTIAMCFCGEEFSDPSVVSDLKAKGHAPEDSGAGCLVHLYEEYGNEFAGRLNGWFRAVLLDLRERKTLVFNDRYGMGRIYYHENADAVFFASEAKALLRILPRLREIDPSGLGEFFSLGCVLDNRTLFREILLMPGGSLWIFKSGAEARKKLYFNNLEWERSETLAQEDYYEKLRDTFVRVLPRYLSAEKRIGISLTGGVDSRLIMAWAAQSPGSFPCYTFGGPYRDCRDVRVARRVAAICHQEHHTLRIDRGFFQSFPSLAEQTVYLTDGALSVGAAPDVYLNRLARQLAPVRLTGNYGGEILRGVRAFGPCLPRRETFAADFARYVEAAAKSYAATIHGHPVSFAAFKQAPWHHYGRLSLEQSQLTVRSPYLDNALVALAYEAPLDRTVAKSFFMRLIAEGNPALGRIPTDRGVGGGGGPLIRWMRRAFQEATFKAEYVFDYGMPEWLVKMDRAASRLRLEELFLGRHKFAHFRVWYREALSAYVRDMLLDSRTLSRPYLNGPYVSEQVRAHIEGRTNYTAGIHALLTSELIQRLFLERS